MNTALFSIAAVERDTGLSKDVLRVWERRYGFPTPQRDVHGERLYPADQVERLHLIKRLMDQGHRPGKLVDSPLEALQALTPRPGRTAGSAAAIALPADLEPLLDLIRQHDSTGFRQAMQQRLARQGLAAFVQDTVAPLTVLVGTAWEAGTIAVFEEHLFTELTKRLLRQAIAGLPAASAGPRILLTSVPEEQHLLGLLMVEALLALEGADCIPLGTQTPLLDIARAAQAHGADIVALSFSVAFPHRQIGGLLEQLRQLLPAGVDIWAGGAGVARLVPPPGVTRLAGLGEVAAALAEWQATHA